MRYVLAVAEINQAIWVLHGKGDAGAFNEGDWAALPEKVRSQLRVFHETRPIVRGLLSFRTGLDAKVRKEVEETLLRLDGDEAGRAALARASGVTRFERLTAADRRELRGWAPILRPARLPLMRLGGIGTRYAVWIAALALALVSTALVAAAFLAFRESRVVQSEIHAAVAAARTSDEEEALRKTATYLGANLFNALYQLDVERLNEEIAQVRGWLPVSSFLVIDRNGRVLTDGTPANERFGDPVPGPRPGDAPRGLLLTRRGRRRRSASRSPRAASPRAGAS